MEKLGSEIAISYRQLQRQFTSFFGITPKEYLKILRITELIKNLNMNNLRETAQTVGYYDQSHMNHDFKRLAGCTPFQIVKNDYFLFMKQIKEGFPS